MDLKYIGIELVGYFFWCFGPVILKRFNYGIQMMLLIQTITVISIISIVIFYYHDKYTFHISEFFTNIDMLYTQIAIGFFYIFANIGYKLLPASISLPITQLTPLSMDLFAHFLYNKKIAKLQYLGFLVTFIGIALISLGKTKISKSHMLIGGVCMIIATLSLGYGLVRDKNIKFKKEVNENPFLKYNIQFLLQNSFTLVIAFVTCIVVYLYQLQNGKVPKYLNMLKVPTFRELLMIVLAYIICQYAVNMLLLTAFDNLDTGIYAGFSAISVLFSLLVGYYVLNEKITKQKILGVIVVITGIALNIYGKTTIES
tara:strand:+ start:38 stop:979 length:942 start_codon:yes stop_codon:yes gene_type:complete